MAEGKKRRPFYFLILAFFAGALLPLAFAPIHLPLFAIISPAIFLFLLSNTNAKQALWRGFVYGVGVFGVGTSWIFISIHVYGETPVWLALILLAGFITIVASYLALQAYLLNRLFPTDNATKILLAFPSSWVLMECLRSWLFTGFPWLLLGYSQTDTALRGYLPIIGVYGLSFLLALLAALLYFACKYYRQWQRLIPALLTMAAIYSMGYYLSQWHWTTPAGSPIKVSLVQGNIDQHLKWSEDFISINMTTYEDLTQPHWDSDIIVWPETAIPIPLAYMENLLEDYVNLNNPGNTTFITGVPVHAKPLGKFHNAIIALGNGQGHYYKYHLVPFGEYIPWEDSLRGIIDFFDLPMTDFVRGEKHQQDIVAGGIPLASFICYEIAYSQAVRKEMPKAQLMITISNDAWFGDSLAPGQHLQIAQARSLQVGREQIFATNDGITALIGADGQIIKKIPNFEAGVLTGYVTPMKGSTPWVRLGSRSILSLILGVFLLAFIVQRYFL